MKVTDDDVKTRGQKEKLEEITSPVQEQAEGTEDKESEDKLKEKEEGGSTEEPAATTPAKLQRDNTMVVTAKVSTLALVWEL